MPDMAKLMNQAAALRERTEKARPRASGRRWYDIRNAAADTTAVYIYDLIGDDGWGGGISAADFVNELRGVRSPNIELHISSEGGQVWDGLAIYEAIKQHPAYVRGKIDSLAASAAGFIAMACDDLEMARNARFMVHDAAMGGAYAAGTAADMRDFAAGVVEMADLLDDMSLNIADIYAQRAGGTAEQWRARMQAGAGNSGTWYSAPAALEARLIDRISGQTTEDAPAPADHKAQDALDFEALRAAIEGVFSA